MDDFKVRCVVNYLHGNGFLPNCNGLMQKRIRELALWHEIKDGVVYLNKRFQQPTGVLITAVDSRSALISWEVDSYIGFQNNCSVEIDLWETNEDVLVCTHVVDYSLGLASLQSLEAGLRYSVAVRFVKNVALERRSCEYVMACTSLMHRSILAKSELQTLLSKAVRYSQGDPGQLVHVMYRNKPQAYFEKIFSSDGVMYPYMKDFNGDLGCPINGQIEGLFFAGKTERNGHLPVQSPFGNTRFVIPVERIFHAGTNLYFADFYCHTVNHYVTVVVTHPYSAADLFCSQYLIPLSVVDNPFFTYSFRDHCRIARKVYVEVFYTSAVDLNWELSLDPRCYMVNTQIFGRGSSKVEGIIKNPNCNICNLYQVKRKREKSPEPERNTKVTNNTLDSGISARPMLKAKRRRHKKRSPAAKSFLPTKESLKLFDGSESKTTTSTVLSEEPTLSSNTDIVLTSAEDVPNCEQTRKKDNTKSSHIGTPNSNSHKMPKKVSPKQLFVATSDSKSDLTKNDKTNADNNNTVVGLIKKPSDGTCPSHKKFKLDG